MHPHRTILAAALSACALLAAGCGGSGSSSPSAVPSSAAARGSSAHEQYAGFARAVNLGSEDVPGFVAEATRREHLHVNNPALEGSGAFRSCFGRLRQGKPVFKASSDKFKSGRGLASESVGSSVEVMRSAAFAAREMALARRILGDARSQACLTHAFDRLGSEGRPSRVGRATLRITVGRLELAPIQVGAPATGTSPGAGLAMTMNVAYHVSTATRALVVPAAFHFDALAFLVGRAEVTLSTSTIGASFPADMEARLLTRLATRAVSASHRYTAVSS